MEDLLVEGKLSSVCPDVFKLHQTDCWVLTILSRTENKEKWNEIRTSQFQCQRDISQSRDIESKLGQGYILPMLGPCDTEDVWEEELTWQHDTSLQSSYKTELRRRSHISLVSILSNTWPWCWCPHHVEDINRRWEELSCCHVMSTTSNALFLSE